jgi:hypothetical protein
VAQVVGPEFKPQYHKKMEKKKLADSWPSHFSEPMSGYLIFPRNRTQNDSNRTSWEHYSVQKRVPPWIFVSPKSVFRSFCFRRTCSLLQTWRLCYRLTGNILGTKKQTLKSLQIWEYFFLKFSNWLKTVTLFRHR